MIAAIDKILKSRDESMLRPDDMRGPQQVRADFVSKSLSLSESFRSSQYLK